MYSADRKDETRYASYAVLAVKYFVIIIAGGGWGGQSNY